MMMGAYMVVVANSFGISAWGAIIAAPLAIAFFGLAVEEILIRRIHTRLAGTILATSGLALVLRQGAVLIFGPGARTVQPPLSTTVHIFQTPYPAYRLCVMGMTLLVILSVYLLFFRTRWGLIARAVMINREMASCLGVDSRHFDRITFAVGAGLAGFAGAIIAPTISIDPSMGSSYGALAFLAVLLGGMASTLAPMVGAALLGSVQSLGATFISSTWAPAITLIMAIASIRLFPRGLFRQKDRIV